MGSEFPPQRTSSHTSGWTALRGEVYGRNGVLILEFMRFVGFNMFNRHEELYIKTVYKAGTPSNVRVSVRYDFKQLSTPVARSRDRYTQPMP